MSGFRCPICSNDVLKSYNGRANAQCTRCKALERGRLQWLVFETLDLLRGGLRVLHFAPERFLLERFSELHGETYHPCDIEPERYSTDKTHVFPMDICGDLAKFPSRSFDLIVHNHVLEHIPCCVEDALLQMKRVLAPGGAMVFSVPFRGRFTDEDLDPSLSDAERRERFAQADHMRIFGRDDFVPLLKNVLQLENPLFRATEHYTEEQLKRFGVPVRAEPNGHSSFVYLKPQEGPAPP